MMTVEQFKAEVWAWAKEIGVSPKEVHMRPMKRKWASCSSKGRVSFDPALLDEAEPVRHEAILHELLHLRFPNHGRMFKRLLAAYLARGLDGGNGKVVA